nr:membrane protein-like protein [Aggregatibacter actinomycetemcomitans]
MYYLAKIFTLLVSIAILYFASVQYRLSIPVLLILSLPMTMFQMGSTNPDSIIFSLSVFIGSLLARGLDSNYNFTHKDFCKLLFSIFLCVTVKFNMLVLLLLPFFISKRREIRHGSMYSIFIIILSILWIVLAMKLTEAQSHFKEGALHNFSYYIFHMDDLFEIFKNTLNLTYLKSLLRMFLGVLGWVDTKFTINEYLFFGSTSLLAYIFLFIHNLYKLKYVIVSVLLVGVVFLFTHFILLITYNEIGTTQIVGVQGRYFIPIMLIIFSSFILKKSEKTSNNKTISKYFIIVPFLFLFISSFITINTLVSRYYMG